MANLMTSSERGQISCQPRDQTADETGERLRELVARGFQFVHPRDPDGNVIAVVGVRVHRDLADVVQLRSPGDVLATRIPAGERDVLSPATVLWERQGEARVVLDELLALPEPRSSGADARGCWLAVRPGYARWLSAS